MNACTPTYARYIDVNTGFSAGASAVVLATSEGTCISGCSTLYGNGKFFFFSTHFDQALTFHLSLTNLAYLGINWIPSLSTCTCHSGTVSSLSPASGVTASYLGACSQYLSGDRSFSTNSCQTTFITNGICMGLLYSSSNLSLKAISTYTAACLFSLGIDNTPCDIGTTCTADYFVTSSGSCSTCMLPGVASCGPVTNTDLTCYAGYGLVNGACVACLGGFFSPGGIAICIACDAGSYAAAISGSCTACPINSFSSAAGTTTCTACSPGYVSNSKAIICTHCGAGTYATPLGTCPNCMLTIGITTCGPVYNTANTW